MDVEEPVTAESLRRHQEVKHRTNHYTYKMIFDTACSKLKRASLAGADDCRITIPTYLFGRPMFNINHASKYVRRKLQARGFDVQIIHATLLMVSWVKTSKPRCHTVPEERQVSLVRLEVPERVFPAPLPPPPETSRPPKPKPVTSGHSDDAASNLLKEIRDLF